MLGHLLSCQPARAAILVALALAAPHLCVFSSSQAVDAAAYCAAGSECGGSGEDASLLAVNILRHAADAPDGGEGSTAVRGKQRGRPGSPRCRCADASMPCWPCAKTWRQLNRSVGGRLFASDLGLPQRAIFSPPASLVDLENPQWNALWVQNYSELAMSIGSRGRSGWGLTVSAYYVAVRCPRDIQEAVRFASKHDLRLVVKGAGHDYLGRSAAPNSLLIWTNRLQEIKWHPGNKQVTVQAGVIWEDVYTQAQQRGRYVVGGSCPTVGAAGGYVLGGGYGEKGFSRLYGTAAENMIKATVILANGKKVVVSPISHPRLFWALRGGGGGTFAIVYDITYKTHEAPRLGGILQCSLQGTDDAARFAFTTSWISFVNSSLLKRNFGLTWRPGRIGRGREAPFAELYFWDTPDTEMDDLFSAFHASVAEITGVTFEYWMNMSLSMTVDGQTYAKLYPTEDGEQSIMYGPAIETGKPGQYIYEGYTQDSYLYSTLYYSARVTMEDYAKPADFAMKLYPLIAYNTDFWLATGKALGGDVAETGQKISMDPRAWTSASLMLSVNGILGYWPGRKPTREALGLLWERMKPKFQDWDSSLGRYFGIYFPECGKRSENLTAQEVVQCWQAVDEYVANVSDFYSEKAIPAYRSAFNNTGVYGNEADYGEPNWQQQQWGSNYENLYEIKQIYDPEGLFVCHHCVGSEDWSADGNCLLPSAPR